MIAEETFSIKMLEDVEKKNCEKCELPSIYLLAFENIDQYLCKDHFYEILRMEEKYKVLS